MIRAAMLSLSLVFAAAATAGDGCPPLLDRHFESLQDGARQSLCQYRGKVILVVNTASQCGFTGQYDGLEKLQRSYGPQGLVVLGFPSNDFGGQEPGSNREIAEFCRTSYGVKFPMFAKSSVRGASANPLFADLAQLSGRAPGWNFHKYLIGRDGRTVDSFASQVAPEDAALVRAIEARLSGTAANGGGT